MPFKGFHPYRAQKSTFAGLAGAFPLKRGRKGLKQIRLFERFPFEKEKRKESSEF
jgi:hypothetical protein